MTYNEEYFTQQSYESFKTGVIKSFLEKKKLKKFVTTKPVLQKLF